MENFKWTADAKCRCDANYVCIIHDIVRRSTITVILSSMQSHVTDDALQTAYAVPIFKRKPHAFSRHSHHAKFFK